MESCVFCRADLKAHCKTGHPTCRWLTCPECKTVIDPDAMRALRGSEPVPWPHAKPEPS